jgi:hypothetical protein
MMHLNVKQQMHNRIAKTRGDGVLQYQIVEALVLQFA